MKKEPETKKKGRPRIHKSDTHRLRAYRERQRKEFTRIDAYIDASACWRLDRLAKAWECSRGGAIQRLIMEADEQYNSILFPEAD